MAKPKATGGSKRLVSPKEDVVKGIKEDVKRLNPTAKKPLTPSQKGMQKSAASRAAGRLLTRGGLVGIASEQGYKLGQAIEKSTGIGKKIGSKLADIQIKAKLAEKNQTKKNLEIKNRRGKK